MDNNCTLAFPIKANRAILDGTVYSYFDALCEVLTVRNELAKKGLLSYRVLSGPPQCLLAR